MPELHSLFLGAIKVELPALLNTRILPALEKFTASGAHITCENRDSASWPDLPPLREIHFEDCHGGALRHYAVPAIFKALSLSDDAWDRFEVMDLMASLGDYHRRAFITFLDNYVGRAVGQKFKGFSTSRYFWDIQRGMESDRGSDHESDDIDLDHLTEVEDLWDGEWDGEWVDDGFLNAEAEAAGQGPFVILD